MQQHAADFHTSDLHLAAFLFTLGRPLRRVNGSAGKHTFTFGNVEAGDVTAFYSGAKVDARLLLASLRDLKGVIREARNVSTRMRHFWKDFSVELLA
jgi:hypothetical protein